MRLLPCGDAAILAELGTQDEVIALHAALAAEPPRGALDVVPAARTLLIRVDHTVTSLPDLARAIRSAQPRATPRPDLETVVVPVTYDGDDLAEVTAITGLGRDGVVAAHTGQLWTVVFAGFAPGFGYLVGENGGLQVPRRATPRTRVPAGAVALAGEYSGIYPSESPGGWQLIGRTSITVWDLDRDPPALLRPGVRVRFVRAT